MRNLSIVVPVYYNEASIAGLFEALDQLESELAKQRVALQVICVNDGSGDRSLAELLKAKQARSTIVVVSLARNFGSFQAIKTGLQFATGDAFMWLAADLQDPPELVARMVAEWLNGSKFVICVRRERDDPTATKLWASLYYVLVRTFVSRSYPRGGFDMALIDSAFIRHFQESGKNINLSLLAHWLGLEPFTIEYHRRPRHSGKSRWTFGKKLKLFIDSVFGFSVAPIRAISLLGLIVSLCSFAYGVIVVASALAHSTPVRGFAALASLLSFLLGLIIVMLGIIGEYIWRIFDQTNQRPEAVIHEVYK